MNRASVWVIGCGQLVNWGVLYFAYSVLLVPLEQDFNAPRWLVAGAFSLGLFASALTAPAAGRLADRGLGPLLVQAGGFAAAALLALWAAFPHIITTYIVWTLLGTCMSAVLYEPVFAIVGRALGNANDRMRAIATVTVLGGLASSVFLPGTAALVHSWGWRVAVLALAAITAIMTAIVGRTALRGAEWSLTAMRDVVAGTSADVPEPLPGLWQLALVFAVSALVNAAVASNLVAALIDGGFAPTPAATIAGLFGWMQLPGRLLMTSPRFMPRPAGLVVFSFALQIAGLLALVMHTHVSLIAGVLLFAAGAGLTTLSRPYWVLQRYGAERAGTANGITARAQQLARAAGPVSAAAVAESLGYQWVFGALAALLMLVSLLTITWWSRAKPLR